MARRKKDPPPSFATHRPTWDRNHYVMLFDDQLNSPAYRALSAHAKEAYTILRQEYTGPYSGNQVICPYATFQEKGMRANTLSRALLQLEVFGFIDIDHGGLEHRPSVYHFSGDWKKIETEKDVEEAKARFQEKLDRKKRARELAAIEKQNPSLAPYGRYISSNESDSYGEKNTGGNANESDSILQKFLELQLAKELPEQVTETVVTNEKPQVTESLVAEEPAHFLFGPAKRDSKASPSESEIHPSHKAGALFSGDSALRGQPN